MQYWLNFCSTGKASAKKIKIKMIEEVIPKFKTLLGIILDNGSAFIKNYKANTATVKNKGKTKITIVFTIFNHKKYTIPSRLNSAKHGKA